MRSFAMRVTDYAGASLDKKSAQWLRDIRAQTAPRPHLALDPRRAALLVIDMLVYFASPNGRCFVSASAPIVSRIGALVDAFRALERPIVFTRHCHRGEEDLGMLGRFFNDYIKRGEPESEIIDALRPNQGDIVVEKTTYDAFIGTMLEHILNETASEQVVITGVLTHMCCETTARSAFCRGFEVFLPVDATASSQERLHVGSLMSIADAVGIVMSVEEVLKRCSPRT
jgi:bifunctional isochorismate lyase/aryl carrier protein